MSCLLSAWVASFSCQNQESFYWIQCVGKVNTTGVKWTHVWTDVRLMTNNNHNPRAKRCRSLPSETHEWIHINMCTNCTGTWSSWGKFWSFTCTMINALPNTSITVHDGSKGMQWYPLNIYIYVYGIRIQINTENKATLITSNADIFVTYIQTVGFTHPLVCKAVIGPASSHHHSSFWSPFMH